MSSKRMVRDAIVRLRSALTQPNNTVGRKLSRLRADCRAGATMMIVFLMMVMILFVAFSLDALNMMTAAQQLNHAAQMAALAGGNTLKTYYSTGNTATLTAAANTLFADDSTGGLLHSPTAVTTIGTWSNKSFTATTTSPNAVMVTATGVANTFFGTLLGRSSYPITKTAVVTIGGARPSNIVLVNDTSGSFSPNMSHQQAADKAVLNCIASSAQRHSRFGIVTFDGTSTSYIPMTEVTEASKESMSEDVDAMRSCSGHGEDDSNPSRCSGSNAAAGIYSARTMLDDLNCPTCNNHIVVLTDGLPNYNSSVSYTPKTGTCVSTETRTQSNGYTSVFTTKGSGASTTPVCGVGTNQSCGTNTDSYGNPTDMLHMAEGQAASAGDSKHCVSTIYYSGDTSDDDRIEADRQELEGWTKNGGIAIVAKTSDDITASANGVCSLLGVRLASTTSDE